MAVNMNKVTLDKSRPSVSLTKRGEVQGNMRVNLNWTQGSTGGFFKRNKGIDLDLAAMYELADGTKGIVQALGNSFGDLNQAPFIFLDGDDRSGTNSGGENLFINLGQVNAFRRILIFAYIYEGAPNWSAANGLVTLVPTSGPQVEVALDSADDRAISCAVAMLTNVNGEMQVSREVRYIQGAQRAVDEAYGFGMRWTAGRK
ncbi:Tellurium resistance [Gordonia sp. (in: high G+C Gram-positive bacteria)]|uniref:TerD family protein n=1 Tax=Gordonia sp. (in: high G+C Gram-positive bacteria) TaxID=84139 RepID=UPI0016A896CF|nr:Tellurium resistance [Gordonia sp. (in: high G+C Gram-positive bacteria)]NLG48195.1 Tellurium resistance [Gordonia sp. (in: high G+C Gram-positive bacteria)]